jgi:hypothetical protein
MSDFNYTAPKLTPERIEAVHQTATAFAARHSSDPWADGRISLRMRQGLVDPDDVLRTSGPIQ